MSTISLRLVLSGTAVTHNGVSDTCPQCLDARVLATPTERTSPPVAAFLVSSRLSSGH